MKRIAIFVLATLAVVVMALSLAPKATALNEDRERTVTISYPASGIVLSSKGEDAVILRSTVHVQAFPLSPELKNKYGDDPIASEDVTCGNNLRFTLPLGRYELQFTTRDGKETKTTIEALVLRSDAESAVVIDFSTAKTLVIGGTLTMQQLENAVLYLDRRVIALQAEVAALKGGKPAAAVPAK